MNEVLDSISEFISGCLAFFSGDDFPGFIRDFCIQLVATIILFLFVRFFLWNTVTKLLESKRVLVDKELDDAKRIKEEALELQEKYNVQLAKAKEEVKELLENAKAEGAKAKEAIIKEAKEEAAKRIQSAQNEIEYEINRQKDDIKSAIVDIAFLAAEKIIGKEVSREEYLELVNSIIESGR